MAKLDGDRITEVSFLAKGCVPAIACGSALTELIKGKNLREAMAVGREDLLRELCELPQAATHAGHLAMDALAALLRSKKK